MNKDKIQTYADKLKSRYYSEHHGNINHFSMCKIYSADIVSCYQCGNLIEVNPTCNCGLLHDLHMMQVDLNGWEEVQKVKKIVPFGKIRGFRDYDLDPITAEEKEFEKKFQESLLTTETKDKRKKQFENQKINFYYLTIKAESPETEIWVGDLEGNLIVKQKGTLEACLMEGRKAVSFGLNEEKIPFDINEDIEYHERDLRKTPSDDCKESEKI